MSAHTHLDYKEDLGPYFLQTTEVTIEMEFLLQKPHIRSFVSFWGLDRLIL
jgi:hypothetical protein